MNVLILDDDENLCKLVERIIIKMDYQPIPVHSISEARECIGSFDLAIVDINLPDGSGYEFAKELRDQNDQIGIIILTVRDTTEDKIRGYIEGADIYLPKPFSPSELTAIVYSLSRRCVKSLQEQPVWRLDSQKRILMCPKRRTAELTERETVFLELLFSSERNIISKRQYVEALGFRWIEFDNRRFDTLISRMRKRIREQIETDIPLKADRRGNYYFVSPCEITQS